MTETSVLYETHQYALCGVLLRMSSTMKSIAIVCDPDAAVRLRQIAKLWPRVIAAQQSNIVGEACDQADQAFLEQLQDGTLQVKEATPRVRIPYDNNSMAPTDEFRLKELIRLWPGIRPSTQRDLVEKVELVTGASFATSE
jgi:hypothetical protein